MRPAEPETRGVWQNRQPIAVPGAQRRQHDVEADERDAARAWLAHVEAWEGGPSTSSGRAEQAVRRESEVEAEERDAARAWLAHVEAGRIGGI